MLPSSEGSIAFLGIIMFRLEGLIQNGVIPYEERPVWYDVYKAFPPRVEPTYNRPIPEKIIPPILYPEDVERAYVSGFIV